MKTPENVPDNNVGNKTPEEVKKGLCCCVTDIAGCKGCPFDNSSDDGLVWECTVDSSALAYIQQLESRLAQAERERDALKHDMRMCQSAVCNACKHHYRPNPDVRFYECALLGRFSDFLNSDDDRPFICGKFEWRGVCLEEDPHDR